MTPSAPKMGRIPLPDVGEGEGKISLSASYSSTSSSYSSRSASSYSGSDDGFSDYAPSSPVPRIRAPAPRRPIATSSCCTTPRICTPQPPPSTPILKPALKRSPVGRTTTPLVESFRAPVSRTSTPQASSPPLSERSSTARKDVPKKPLKGILKRPTPSTTPSTSPGTYDPHSISPEHFILGDAHFPRVQHSTSRNGRTFSGLPSLATIAI